tara:strand:+ start:132 stop:605 length:474 start_codon:yes stop_codon:yes gene_type:complete
MQTFDNYKAASKYHTENGGWLLQTGYTPNYYAVTDDQATVIEMRGEDFIYQCESCDTFDETKTGLIQAQFLNDAGKEYVTYMLTERLKLKNMDVAATISEIEDKMFSLPEMLEPNNDVFYFEISNNTASRSGVCQAGYGVFFELELTSDMFSFENVA